jgi:hypothetical protein
MLTGGLNNFSVTEDHGQSLVPLLHVMSRTGFPEHADRDIFHATPEES